VSLVGRPNRLDIRANHRLPPGRTVQWLARRASRESCSTGVWQKSNMVHSPAA